MIGQNIEKYVKELTPVYREMFKATGAMFEQEHLCFISMITASRSGGSNGGGYHKTVMKKQGHHGDKSLFRQLHQKFISAL